MHNAMYSHWPSVIRGCTCGLKVRQAWPVVQQGQAEVRADNIVIQEQDEVSTGGRQGSSGTN